MTNSSECELTTQILAMRDSGLPGSVTKLKCGKPNCKTTCIVKVLAPRVLSMDLEKMGGNCLLDLDFRIIRG